MMKIVIAIFILLADAFSVSAQSHFGIRLSGGASKLHVSSNAITKDKFTLSGDIGAFYQSQFGKKSMWSVELLFSQIEGKQRHELDLVAFDGAFVGTVKSDLYRHISYLSIPVSYGFKIKGLTINAGILSSVHLTSGGRDKSIYTDSSAVVTEWDNKFGKLNIDPFNFGAIVGLTVRLSDNFQFDGRYYYGLNNILNVDASSSSNWRVEQGTIGLLYTFKTLTKDTVD